MSIKSIKRNILAMAAQVDAGAVSKQTDITMGEDFLSDHFEDMYELAGQVALDRDQLVIILCFAAVILEDEWED